MKLERYPFLNRFSPQNLTWGPFPIMDKRSWIFMTLRPESLRGWWWVSPRGLFKPQQLAPLKGMEDKQRGSPELSQEPGDFSQSSGTSEEEPWGGGDSQLQGPCPPCPNTWKDSVPQWENVTHFTECIIQCWINLFH